MWHAEFPRRISVNEAKVLQGLEGFQLKASSTVKCFELIAQSVAIPGKVRVLLL